MLQELTQDMERKTGMKRRIDDILFNGYVREPVPMVFLATLVGIVALVFAIWSSIPSNADTNETNLIFISYKEDGPIYILTALNGDTYYIPQKAVEDTYVIAGLVDEQQFLN